MSVKKTYCVHLDESTHARLKQYAHENHISGGVSGVIEHLAWKAKVKNEQVREQIKISEVNYG